MPQPAETDLLIWGNIPRYEEVSEFARFATRHSLKLETRIIGKCSSTELLEELRTGGNDRTSVGDWSIPFDELEQEIRKSRLILISYAAEPILGSGVLMNSLSFGTQVIGPDVGSFEDYVADSLLNVYTFHTFRDIPSPTNKVDEAVNIANHSRFLGTYSRNKFGKKFQNLLLEIV